MRVDVWHYSCAQVKEALTDITTAIKRNTVAEDAILGQLALLVTASRGYLWRSLDQIRVYLVQRARAHWPRGARAASARPGAGPPAPVGARETLFH